MILVRNDWLLTCDIDPEGILVVKTGILHYRCDRLSPGLGPTNAPIDKNNSSINSITMQSASSPSHDLHSGHSLLALYERLSFAQRNFPYIAIRRLNPVLVITL